MSTDCVLKVYDIEGKPCGEFIRPPVFNAPIRPDLIRFIHSQMAKNSRQPYAISRLSGLQTPAASWGPGRAVARVPRVPGSGTRRSGQAARTNMARGGRMAGPTSLTRRWYRKINVNQKRYAVVSAIACSAISGMVQSRGHLSNKIPQLPLVVNNDMESVKTTKQAVEIMSKLGLADELQRVKESKTMRAGKGKARNRRFRMRRGPLVVYNRDGGLTKAFRNIPGVDVAHVSSLSLLDLAPGSHPGRLILWSEGACKALNDIFGSTTTVSKVKFGYTLPMPIAENPSMKRIIANPTVKAVLRKKRRPAPRIVRHNALTHMPTYNRLNPKQTAEEPKKEVPVQEAVQEEV